MPRIYSGLDIDPDSGLAVLYDTPRVTTFVLANLACTIFPEGAVGVQREAALVKSLLELRRWLAR
jgi:hypothetical protein